MDKSLMADNRPADGEPLPQASSESEPFLMDGDRPSESFLHNTPDHHERTPQLSEHKKTLLKTGAINVLLILLWYLFATFLSVYNKWMFSADHYNFQFPLFVTSIHMIVQCVFSGMSLLFLPKLRPNKTVKAHVYIFKVLPCAFATSSDIGLSNLSLKTITLSFYTMCKSSTLAFVLLFAFLFQLEKPSLKLVCIILIISTGVLLMVSNETAFVASGFIEVMMASVFGGLRWSLTEILLHKESIGLTNPFSSIFFLAPAQALFLIIISSIIEGYFTIFQSAFFVSFSEGLHTILVILLGGALAFCMIVSEFFLIKRTSVVTLSVCGIFKEVATICVSTIVFGDRLTVINIVGLCVTLFGIGLYNWLKIRSVSMKVRQECRDQESSTLDDLVDSDEDEDDGDRRFIQPRHLYSMVAESTPMLMVDGALTTYKDSMDGERPAKGDQYELH